MNPDTPSEPCEICTLDPGTTSATVTSNRSLFNLNTRQSIEPICEDHVDRTTEETVQTAYEYGGAVFTVTCIRQGVFTEQDAQNHLPENAIKKLETALQRDR